jgi:hypothetical protein
VTTEGLPTEQEGVNVVRMLTKGVKVEKAPTGLGSSVEEDGLAVALVTLDPAARCGRQRTVWKVERGDRRRSGCAATGSGVRLRGRMRLITAAGCRSSGAAALVLKETDPWF